MVWVSDEERRLVEAKAKHYGYKRLAKYIRDAVIYENVTYVDLKNKKEIYDAYAENTKEIKQIAKLFRHISKYATRISNDDIKELSNTMMMIIRKQKEMMNLIEKKLDLEVWQQIQDSNINYKENRCLLQKE